MVELTQEMIDDISKMKIFSFATASKSGVPNVVPIGMLLPRGKDTFWVIDNYMNKTLDNLKENPVASFFVWNSEVNAPIQVKCDATLENSGKDYEAAVAYARKRKETFPAKTLIKLKVRDVYNVKPGSDAGKKLL